MFEIAEFVVLVFGIVICGLSVWGAFIPSDLMSWVRGVTTQDWGISYAIVTRLLLGWALLFAAANARFPQTFMVLGWIAIVAAVGLVFIGQDRFRRLVSWMERLSPTILRIGLLVAVVFGAFLIYGIT